MPLGREHRATDLSGARIAARFTWIAIAAGLAYYIILFAMAH